MKVVCSDIPFLLMGIYVIMFVQPSLRMVSAQHEYDDSVNKLVDTLVVTRSNADGSVSYVAPDRNPQVLDYSQTQFPQFQYPSHDTEVQDHAGGRSDISVVHDQNGTSIPAMSPMVIDAPGTVQTITTVHRPPTATRNCRRVSDERTVTLPGYLPERIDFGSCMGSCPGHRTTTVVSQAETLQIRNGHLHGIKFNNRECTCCSLKSKQVKEVRFRRDLNVAPPSAIISDNDGMMTVNVSVIQSCRCKKRLCL
ncbi:uncharacterized protein LOC135822197 isoform X2 [Sycon ciliatum]|uniref:uncharacterized protein LOC135822197 isoform X2 n=1 Tax=Sycon ciliatum TaxID=27933 RepID=UPI0020A8C4AB|eukprot:scpid70386/ scgid34155/ 